MADKSENLVDMIERETQKRINTYHDFAPGTAQCEITPMTTKSIVPAIVFSFILIGIFVWAGVSVFPRYFPG